MNYEIIIRKVDYGKFAATVKGFNIELKVETHNLDLVRICEYLHKAVEIVDEKHDKVTAVATQTAWRKLKKEYLVAPGKQLLQMFLNNGVDIHECE